MEEMTLIMVYGGTILSVIAVVNSLVTGYIKQNYIIIRKTKEQTQIVETQEKNFNQYNNVL